MDELCDTGEQCMLLYKQVYLLAETTMTLPVNNERNFINQHLGFLWWTIYEGIRSQLYSTITMNNYTRIKL